MVELQAHSTVSDGGLAPAAVVEAARAAGVTALALTDHDAVDGVPEAMEAARAARVHLVPGLELSSFRPELEDLHVLGYHVDLDAIAPACERAQAERLARVERIVERLEAGGVDVTLEAVVRLAGGARAIGRPHIARAAGASDVGAFFTRWLVPGAEAFVPRAWPTSEEAVDIIRSCGGVAVLAHPFSDVADPAAVGRLVDSLPLDGVECFYPTHTMGQTGFLLELCRERGLLATASSDFHGPGRGLFGRFGAYRTYGLGHPDLP